MKSSLPIYLAAVCVGIIIFIAGYFVGDSSSARSAKSERLANSPSSGPSAAKNDAERNAGSAESAEASSAPSSDQTRAQMFELLSEPNHVTRIHRLSEMLAHITPENWRGALEAFHIQTKAEGRLQPDEWKLMIERVAEVAGAEALADALRSESSALVPRARLLLTGFAAANPTAALEWFQAQPPERQQQFFNNLISGLGRSDPKRAMTLILDQPREIWQPNVTSIVDGAIQSGGFRAAEDLLVSIKSRSDVSLDFKGKVLMDLLERHITNYTEPMEVLEWFDPHVSLAGPITIRKSLSAAAKVDPMKTLGWLEERADRIAPKQVPVAYAAIAEVLQAQNPAQFVAWMNANPNHPQHDSMAQVAINTFLQSGNFDEARRWMATIGDPRMRGQLDEAIRAAEVKAQSRRAVPPQP
jgi:hypothetical protein